jgi:hypothetical protein
VRKENGQRVAWAEAFWHDSWGLKGLGIKIELAKEAGSDFMRDTMILYTYTTIFV